MKVGNDMVYLDYSATTPVNKEVLESFDRASLDYIGNPNSLHKLGLDAKKIIDSATKQLKELLHLHNEEIIYTSGASEANNLALKGVCFKYANRGKKIITTELEHSSIYGPLSFLQRHGFTVSFVNLDEKGRVDLQHLESLIDDETLLVTISTVNSETGIVQPVDEIAKLVSKYPKCFFHTDITQAVGKYPLPQNFFEKVDFASFSAHKFYGLKGIGCLIKKESISIEPLIHGGKSTSLYRSGTPTTALIVSVSKALRLALDDIDQKYAYVKQLNAKIKDALSKYADVSINSNEYSIPHIFNLSVLKIKPETMLHALEEDDIYISTQSACSSNNTKSRAVYAVTNNEEASLHSLRISLSYLTTKEEIDTFLASFDKWYHKLNLR